jgi:hypothetical protein
MKKFFTYPVFVVLFLSFIGAIGFGGLLKHHYAGGERFQFLQNIAVTIAEVPSNIKKILFSSKSELLLAKDRPEFKDYKAGFNFKNKKELDILFLLNYTNPSNNKHEINLIDLQTYKSIFKYKTDYELFTKIKSENNEKLSKYITDDNFALRSTFLTKNLNFIALTTGNIITKFSLAKNEVVWFNDDYNFHHTFNVNEIEKYIWAIGCSKNSKLDKRYLSKDFCDDSVIKIDLNTGKIIDEISVTQIMIDEGIHNHLFVGRSDISVPDPLHINDVEEVNSNTNFTNKGNLFISLGHTNMILLINPYTKKILWKLHDKLFHQHDVDIINDDEIAIFNNNRIITNKDKVFKNNEINVYNFKTNELSSPYDNILKENDVRTVNQGLMEITEYGIFVEEQNSGRYIFFENNGNVIFEYLNKSENNRDVYQVHWSRLIVNKDKINEIKRKLKYENN